MFNLPTKTESSCKFQYGIKKKKIFYWCTYTQKKMNCYQVKCSEFEIIYCGKDLIQMVQPFNPSLSLCLTHTLTVQRERPCGPAAGRQHAVSPWGDRGSPWYLRRVPCVCVCVCARVHCWKGWKCTKRNRGVSRAEKGSLDREKGLSVCKSFTHVDITWSIPRSGYAIGHKYCNTHACKATVYTLTSLTKVQPPCVLQARPPLRLLQNICFYQISHCIPQPPASRLYHWIPAKMTFHPRQTKVDN